jgi:hypothetical protein
LNSPALAIDVAISFDVAKNAANRDNTKNLDHAASSMIPSHTPLRRIRMSLAELMPTLSSLPRHEKLEVLRRLAFDLTQEAGVDVLQDGASYPIWTPFNAHDAAKSLQRLLEEDRERK